MVTLGNVNGAPRIWRTKGEADEYYPRAQARTSVDPQRVATLYEGRVRTWIEVGDRVSRLACALKRSGLGQGERVAARMLNSDRYLELYLGMLWAGAVIVPLNTRWSVLENADALRDCGASVLVVDETFARVARTLPGATGSNLKLVYADDGEPPEGMESYEALIKSGDAEPDVMRDEGHLAGIFYTGGTTGRSKGVMLSYRNLMANARNMLAEGFGQDDRIFMHAAPMFHIANAGAMFSLLLGGGANVVVKRFNPDAVFDAIERYRVTNTVLVPTMIQLLVDNPSIGSRDLASLKRIGYGASPISEALLDRAMTKLPNVEFVQAYGMTELSPVATVLHFKHHLGEGRASGRHRSAGRATFGVHVEIVDVEGRVVPCGTIGEIVVRGDTVMMGYWNRPEETARTLVDGWMHTGDAGYMDEHGFVYVVDRIKDMIISGGENVYSAEVENVIAHHPAVAQCAVIGIPNKLWGEQVHAIVVTKTGMNLTPEELIGFCSDRIAGYKCPRSVDFRAEPLRCPELAKS